MPTIGLLQAPPLSPSGTERARSDLLFASGSDPLGPRKQPSPQGVNFGRLSGVNFEGRLTIWSQISLRFLMAFLNGGGALSGVVGWSTMVLLEIMNVYGSWSDVGKNMARR
jgi:hypothetical protein